VKNRKKERKAYIGISFLPFIFLAIINQYFEIILKLSGVEK